jgi:hypothetical protein
MTKVTKFEIKRSQWARGSFGALERPDGKCCVMGHYAKACGVPKDALLSCHNIASARGYSKDTLALITAVMPDWAWVDLDDLPFFMRVSVVNIYNANDDNFYCDRTREEIIIRSLRSLGITVTFTD